jgi:hypothetical protein
MQCRIIELKITTELTIVNLELIVIFAHFCDPVCVLCTLNGS